MLDLKLNRNEWFKYTTSVDAAAEGTKITIFL